jgi:hypothetical protein
MTALFGIISRGRATIEEPVFDWALAEELDALAS